MIEDTRLVRILFDLRDRYGLEHWVELGAHEGRTVEWARRVFRHVWACETYPPRQKILAEKFEADPRVRLFQESCLTALPKIFREIGTERTLVFDDAHWEDTWPLTANLKFMLQHTRGLVLIHDAFVPGHSNFVGCHGGCGSADPANGGRKTSFSATPLDEALIRSVLGELPLLWPAYSGEWLGWCIANLNGDPFPDFEETFQTGTPCLRP